MDFRKCTSLNDAPSVCLAPLKFSQKVHAKAQFEEQERATDHAVVADVGVDLREVYFLIMHFLSVGPCQRTFGQFWNELLEHQLLPKRYHAWYSRSGACSGDENDDGISFPLTYDNVVERYSHIEKDHLVKLLKQMILSAAPLRCMAGRSAPRAADVPTLLGSGPFSLLGCTRDKVSAQVKPLSAYLRWPHMQADQVRGLSLREIGGGFPKHHRAPSIRFACYAIAKPSTMVQKMQNIKKLRGHRNAVYCAIFDRSGRYVITGSDDRLVKIWSMETAFSLASCRGHEGDITDLAVSSNNVLVASASNDYSIRVWRLPDGLPISVLRGHIGAVTAIAFSPRPSSVYQILSSSDDGTCRIWDARYSQFSPRIYLPKSTYGVAGQSDGPSSSSAPQCHQILCCAYNANGTVFVTGSSDTFARVWSACKSNPEDSEQPDHEIDVLPGHENDVNYVQFSGCAVASRSSTSDSFTEETIPKFKNSWFSHDNIVTCSRDGSAIIWIPRSRRSHGKVGRWTRAYHLKVPPPPMPPQPPRGGPRQRFLPTPRGVNMIVWSLDNRFVLAAIMDCRICVWNASDGSLVHSLTGHTASTYVLDVHPFNPRIAMSAGYDGKTIVWDIWEGTPIRIYEIGRFKLVDGKFSPDGTLIVLSDDVGQIYLLNTGQGESQKDAKYDQFFLGDYRPLIQDTHGNVLDQETQLAPYRRNIQDPLCDSSMLPYPEPYQSMYQKRRLGALGIEWRPSSIKFAIGTDIGLGQEYQILPDLDIVIEPLPEFIDAMYWEPEIDVINDDADSEYNITDEYSSEDEHGSFSNSSSNHPECSEEDKKVERSHKDGLRRSKRKKPKAEVELWTSERRSKRRILDEHDGTSSRSKRAKKSRNRWKTLKKKSSKVKPFRPQRVAARNAVTFSHISEASTDGEDDSEDDSSESESLLQDSNIQNNKPDDNWLNMQQQDTKGEEESLYDESNDVVKPPKHLETQTNGENRRKLVVKFIIPDSKKSVPSESTRVQCNNQADLASSSSTHNEKAPKENWNKLSSRVPGSPSADVSDLELSENHNRFKFRGSEEIGKVEDHLDMSESYKNTKIKLGDCVKRGKECGNSSPGSGIQNHGAKLLSEAYTDKDQFGTGTLEDMDNARNIVCNRLYDISTLGKCQHSGSASGVSCSGNLNDNPTPKPIKLRIKSKKILGDSKSPSKLKLVTAVDVPTADGGDLISQSPSCMEKNLVLGVAEADVGSDGPSSVQRLHSDLNTKIDDSFYKRAKSHRLGSVPEVYGGEMGESTSKASSHNHEAGIEFPEYATDAMRRTRSLKWKATSRETNDVNHNFKAGGGYPISVRKPKSAEKSSQKASDQLPLDEWMLTSKMTIRSRSTRNKGDGYYNDAQSTTAGTRSQYAPRKSNWLLLSRHEEAYRYIPQLGDEVVYLRQGHQEYMESKSSSVVGPRISLGENIRAVEICLVEDLDYATVPGSGENCCKIKLKFIDSSSSVFGQKFKLTLPELNDIPDFIVERTRYDAAIRRNWTSEDTCQVWWRDESEDGGSWWDGWIYSSDDKSDKYPGSPWERYEVRYISDPTAPHQHSPWELQDPDTIWEHPHIDPESRDEMLSAFAKLEKSASKNQDKHGILKLKQVAQKLDFVNRFPVPLSPEIIELRLANNYYRSLEAMKHDITVMLLNAQTYFRKNAEFSTKMKRLSDWLTRTLTKL